SWAIDCRRSPGTNIDPAVLSVSRPCAKSLDAELTVSTEAQPAASAEGTPSCTALSGSTHSHLPVSSNVTRTPPQSSRPSGGTSSKAASGQTSETNARTMLPSSPFGREIANVRTLPPVANGVTRTRRPREVTLDGRIFGQLP